VNLYASNRLDRLIDRLAENTTEAGLDPIKPSVIVVQSPGMERWISMQLAHRLGVWANCRFPFPNALVNELMDTILLDQYAEKATVFDRPVLKWRIFDIIRKHSGDPAFEVLSGYMGASPSPLRTYQLAEQVADVFDQYMVYRPQMLLEWEDGAGTDRPEDSWQPALWQMLSAPYSGMHRARMKQRFHQKLRGMKKKEFHQRYGDSVPSVIHLFGVTSLPPFHVEMLAEISRFIPVHVYQLNPCRQFWYDIEREAKISRIEKHYNSKYGDVPEHHMEVGNSLLASLGLVGKKFIPMVWEYVKNEPFDDASYQELEAGTLLQHVQNDILNLVDRGAPGSGESKKSINDADRSIQVHSCHGPMREAEVLRDVLLDLFENNNGLEPQDILVMVTDIDMYAPYIDAVFGNPGQGEQFIPYSIADQNLRNVSNTVETFFAVLECIDSRFEASRVFQVLQSGDISRKFGLSPSDLDTIQGWIRETGIHWGIDAAHRERLDQPASVLHSWRYGLDRMLLGFAMPGDDSYIYNDILPYDHVEGDSARVLGGLAEFCHVLFSLVEDLSVNAGIQDWAAMVNRMIDLLFLPDDNTQRYVQMIRDRVNDLAQRVTPEIFDGEIDLRVLRSWLQNEISQERVSTSFMTGGITFCATLPMRSIPFRVICMMGMNDDTFPRKDRVRGFDLMYQQAEPRPGDRSARNDDRYLFLETIVSAREKLCITYTGQSARDNSTIPPSVVVSELLDYVSQAYVVNDGTEKELPGHLVTVHHLQPFSPAYFTGHEKLFSYSGLNLEACKRLMDPLDEKAEFINGKLPPLDLEKRSVIPLEELSSFYDNPAKLYCAARLGVRPELYVEEIDDREPFHLDNLQVFRIKSEFLQKYLDGEDIDSLKSIIKARGVLPHGLWGDIMYAHTESESLTFAGRVARFLDREKEENVSVDIRVGPARLTGSIEGIMPGQLVIHRPVNTKGRDIMRGWIRHCAMNACIEGTPRTTVCVFNDAIVHLEPVHPETAVKMLAELVDLYLEGMRIPLPLFAGSSWEYATEKLKGKDEAGIMGKVKSRWEGTTFNGGSPGDKDDPYVSMCFDDAIIQTNEFRSLAMKVYGPVLGSMEIDNN